MKIAVLSITAGGAALADRLCKLLDQAVRLPVKDRTVKISQLFAENWEKYDAFVCIMAAGIVVRSIAPLLRDKTTDPAVIVLDEKAQFAISLLSGHIGGGNTLAAEIGHKLGAAPVITTSSDTLGLVPLDLWAKAQNLAPPPKTELTAVTAQLVNSGRLTLFSEVDVISLPAGLELTDRADNADIIVSNRILPGLTGSFFRPRNLVIGIGCNRGTAAAECESALRELFQELSLARSAIRNIASVDKKNDELGLLEFATEHGWEIDFYSTSQINTLNNLEISFAALKAIGAIGVAEPTALLSAQSNLLISRKRKWKNVTMAVAQAPFSLSAQVLAPSSR